MLLATTSGFGLVPDWQFSADPNINIKLNPHALKGLGAYHRAPRVGTEPGCCDGGQTPDACCGGGIQRLGFRTGRLSGLRDPLAVFESPVWTHRKWFVLGGVALVGLSIMAGAGALLR